MLLLIKKGKKIIQEMFAKANYIELVHLVTLFPARKNKILCFFAVNWYLTVEGSVLLLH